MKKYILPISISIVFAISSLVFGATYTNVLQSSNGNQGFGTTTPVELLSTSGKIYVGSSVGTSTIQNALQVGREGATTSALTIKNGVPGTGIATDWPALILSNFQNNLTQTTSLVFNTLDGGTGSEAIVRGYAGNNGSQLRFLTSTVAGVLTERLRIFENGNLAMGSVSSGSGGDYGLEVIGADAAERVGLSLLNTTNTGLSTLRFDHGSSFISNIKSKYLTSAPSLGNTELQFFPSVGYIATQALTLTSDGVGTLAGINTTTPAKTLSVQGNELVSGTSTVSGLFATGTIITSNLTVNNGTDFASSTVQQHIYPTFTYATSTTWMGTTTLQLGPAYIQETWYGAKCYTDAGTLTIAFDDGTNIMNNIIATSTVNQTNLAINNIFSVNKKRRVLIGSPISSPTIITCSIDKIVNR